MNKVSCFSCMGCGNDYAVGNKVKAHNNYCGLCDECYNKAVIETKGVFIPKYFIERQAKKSASHGCRVWFEAYNLSTEEKAYIFANYSVARVGKMFVSNAKIGTWQLSKVVDEIGSDRITANVNKDGYILSGKAEIIINAVREISSNHGKITPSIVSKYGFTKK